MGGKDTTIVPTTPLLGSDVFCEDVYTLESIAYDAESEGQWI
jgi:hypothetical protein